MARHSSTLTTIICALLGIALLCTACAHRRPAALVQPKIANAAYITGRVSSLPSGSGKEGTEILTIDGDQAFHQGLNDLIPMTPGKHAIGADYARYTVENDGTSSINLSASFEAQTNHIYSFKTADGTEAGTITYWLEDEAGNKVTPPKIATPTVRPVSTSTLIYVGK